jgi:hypothetical protein
LNGELNNDELTIEIEFWPDRDYDYDATFNLFDTTGSNYYVQKLNNAGSNVLRIVLGGTTIVDVAAATYGSLWRVGQRNLLIISGTTGATDVDLNSSEIVSADATAWTHTDDAVLSVGAAITPANYFDGHISRLTIGHFLATEQEHVDAWNKRTFDWQNRLDLHLLMRMVDHDPDNSKTLNVGNGAALDGILGAGVHEPAKLVRQGYEYDGNDCIQISSYPVNSGAWSLLIAGVSADASLANEYLSDVQTGRILLGWFNTSASIMYFDGTNTRTIANAWTKGDNLIHTAVLTNDGSGQYEFYVDGESVDSFAGVNRSLGGDIGIGCKNSADANYLTGKILTHGIAEFEMQPVQVYDFDINVRRAIQGI